MDRSDATSVQRGLTALTKLPPDSGAIRSGRISIDSSRQRELDLASPGYREIAGSSLTLSRRQIVNVGGPSCGFLRPECHSVRNVVARRLRTISIPCLKPSADSRAHHIDLVEADAGRCHLTARRSGAVQRRECGEVHQSGALSALCVVLFVYPCF